MKYSISVVGATGLVGQTILNVLEELKFPVKTLIPVASASSTGKKVFFQQQAIEVQSIDYLLDNPTDIAIFSAGKAFSLQYAPLLSQKGTVVIDNSSAWRNHDDIPLVIPEVNAHILTKTDKIIANPNCSTIQLIMALYPLHRAFGLKHIVVSTYQSVSGSGLAGIQQLDNERLGKDSEKCYPHPIDLNVIPQGGDFLENGYTEEEMKLVNESQKILNLKDLKVSPTVVRVPVKGGHSESVTATFDKDMTVEEAKTILAEFSGICLQDNPTASLYPMPLFAENKNDVFVGRIRKDLFIKNTLNMWIVADNLRKGAATNAVQIAQYLIQHHLV